MAPSFCTELAAPERRQLLAIARHSIHVGLHRDSRLEVDLQALPAALCEPLGVFVTLTQHPDRLRGCIGTIEPDAPLALAVADSAHGAAFRDPRFPQLAADELACTGIQISVLTPMEPLAADSRQALLAQLQAGEDGLLLQDGRYQSTFLPTVWEQLPAPESFLDHLLEKAGLPADHWSAGLRFHRYQTVCFSDSRSQAPA